MLPEKVRRSVDRAMSPASQRSCYSTAQRLNEDMRQPHRRYYAMPEMARQQLLHVPAAASQFADSCAAASPPARTKAKAMARLLSVDMMSEVFARGGCQVSDIRARRWRGKKVTS